MDVGSVGMMDIVKAAMSADAMVARLVASLVALKAGTKVESKGVLMVAVSAVKRVVLKAVQ